MKKIHEFLSRPVVTVLLFALAIGLLGGSAIGGTRAALNLYSEVYESQVSMQNIGVQLLENGKAVSGSDALLKDLLKQSENKLRPGMAYNEVLTVANTADIDEFVRVTVQAYWLDKDGNKAPDMDSGWIDLPFVTGSGWTIDTKSSTEERTVLYYDNALPVGGETSPFLELLTVKGGIIKKAAQTRVPPTGTPATITTTYVYNDYQMCLKVSVDSVQTHNGQDAVKSAWGKNVTVSGSSLSLS